MSNGGASRSKSAEALRPCTARSVSVSAITAARTWDNRRLPTRSKQRRGLRMLAAMRAASRMAFEPLLESGDLRAERSARSGTKKSDHRHRRLLRPRRSEEHTSELQSREISYAVFCLKKKNIQDDTGLTVEENEQGATQEVVAEVM